MSQSVCLYPDSGFVFDSGFGSLLFPTITLYFLSVFSIGLHVLTISCVFLHAHLRDLGLYLYSHTDDSEFVTC